MRKLCIAIAAAALSIAAIDAGAQMFPRRDRTGSPREEGRKRDAPRSQLASDTFAALERELPSLEVDLLLKPSQVDAWRAFARDVRDVAEAGRAERRHVMALRGSGESRPTAPTFIGSIAEDARARADAAANARRDLQALYDRMDDKQRSMMDRRVVQSQVEPLGQ